MVRVESVDRIMSIYLDSLEKAFTIRELSKQAKLSYDATYRHVGYLLQNQILVEKRVGKARLCRINLESKEARKMIEEASLKRTNSFYIDNADLGDLFKNIIRTLEAAMPDQLLSVVLYKAKTTGVDLLFLVSDVRVKRAIEKICKETTVRYGKRVVALIANITEFEKILETKKQTPNEEIVYGTVLYGYEDYYNLLFRCLR